jgi:hypothetical protein
MVSLIFVKITQYLSLFSHFRSYFVRNFHPLTSLPAPNLPHYYQQPLAVLAYSGIGTLFM